MEARTNRVTAVLRRNAWYGQIYFRYRSQRCPSGLIGFVDRTPGLSPPAEAVSAIRAFLNSFAKMDRMCWAMRRAFANAPGGDLLPIRLNSILTSLNCS